MRADVAKEAYHYYLENIKNIDNYRINLVKKLLERFKIDNERYFINDKNKYDKKLETFKNDMGAGKYILRGENKERAQEVCAPTEYDRVALMAVSVFHLAHGRTNVAAKHYML